MKKLIMCLIYYSFIELFSNDCERVEYEENISLGGECLKNGRKNSRLNERCFSDYSPLRYLYVYFFKNNTL